MNRCRLLLSIATSLLVVGCSDGEIQLVDPPFSDMIDVPSEVIANSGERRIFAADGTPTVLYLNFDGATIVKSSKSDAAANQSFVGGGTVPAFPGTQTQRDEVTALVKQLYADFNIQIVTSRPSSGDYDMALIGGTPSSINAPVPPVSGGFVAGVAPMDCGNVMPRDIAFTFAQSIKSNLSASVFVRSVAETTAHEVAHVYGLPHSADPCDLMSYGQCAQLKTLLDKTMSMQSDSYGKCGLTSMNSYQMMLAELGASNGSTPPPTTDPPTTDPPTTDPPTTDPPAVDTMPPQVAITSPTSGATVAPQITIKISITDDVAVQQYGLYVDGQLVAAKNTTPYEFSGTLTVGQHTLIVGALDTSGNQGNSQPVMITVSTQAPPPTTEPEPTTPPETTEPETPPPPETTEPETETTETETADQPSAEETKGGEYGDPCVGPADCANGLCAQDPDSEVGNYCTVKCDPADQDAACPSDAACQSSNVDLAVCSAPAALNGAADVGNAASGDMLVGGCSVGGDSTPSVPLIVLLLLLVRRRAR